MAQVRSVRGGGEGGRFFKQCVESGHWNHIPPSVIPSHTPQARDRIVSSPAAPHRPLPHFPHFQLPPLLPGSGPNCILPSPAPRRPLPGLEAGGSPPSPVGGESRGHHRRGGRRDQRRGGADHDCGWPPRCPQAPNRRSRCLACLPHAACSAVGLTRAPWAARQLLVTPRRRGGRRRRQYSGGQRYS